MRGSRIAPAHAVPGGVAAGNDETRRGRPGGRKVVPLRETSDDISVESAALTWLNFYVAAARNAKGQALATKRVFQYLGEFFQNRMGGLELRDVTGDHVRQYRFWLEEECRLKPYTVTHVLSDLRCLLRWSVSQGLLARSPFPARVMPRIPEQPPRGLSDLECSMLASVGGSGGFVLRLLLGTGLRWAEACRVTRDDLRGQLLEIWNTKSGRVRRVPLSPGLLEEVRGRVGPLNPFAPGSPGSFSRTVRRVTGIADFHVHRCRHTFAMRWLAAGGNLAVLQHILGHRDLSTTMRYARVTDELITREAERVERGMPR